MTRSAWVLLLVTLVLGCRQDPFVEPVPAPVASRDPITDAEAALERGDRRFLLIGGVWVWRVPGIDTAGCVRRLSSKDTRMVWFIPDEVNAPTNSAQQLVHDSVEAEHVQLGTYLPAYNRVIASKTGRCSVAAS